MSSLRSSRGYSSVTLDRLRYGSSVGPGVLAVGTDGVVGPTGTLNVQSLNVIGTATIDTAVMNTLVIDDVTFRNVSAVDIQTHTLEVSGTGTISYLTVDGITGGTGAFGHMTVSTLIGRTGSFDHMNISTLIGETGVFDHMNVSRLVGGTGSFGYISMNGFTGGTGIFNDLTVNNLHVITQIDDVNHASSIAGDYITGVKIRAGEESVSAVKGQEQALYVKGDAYIEGGITGGSLSTAGAIQGGSLNVTSSASVGSLESITVSTEKIYVNAINPFPSGVTGILSISTGVGITNDNTTDPAKATTLAFSQRDYPENSNVTAYLVGANSSGFGDDDNNKEQFCWYTYPKISFGGGVHKVESTPLKSGTVGPAGVIGAVGDKYFYGSVQALGSIYGATGIFQNISAQNAAVSSGFQGNTGSFQDLTVNGVLTVNGSFVYGVQVI